MSREDVEFVDMFLADELTEEGLIELDEKLLNPDFKRYYAGRLDEKYNRSLSQLFIDYLPMIIMLALIGVGIYLFLK